jgi:hypothetical protein
MEKTMTRAKAQRAPSSEKQDIFFLFVLWRLGEKISRSGSVKHFKTKESKGGLENAAQLFV